MICNQLLIKEANNLVIDFSMYLDRNIRVFGYPGCRNSDCLVNDKFDYPSWVQEYSTFSAIKVEGLESFNSIKDQFNKFQIENIHLFYSQKSSYSFNWHRDNLNVFLYVAKGQKTVFLKDKKFTLTPRKGVLIPRNSLHKVFSKAGTIAYSVGYK